MRVVFRADASLAIGTGHIRRCLALAFALEAHGAEVEFVTRDLGVATADLIAPRRHHVLPASAASLSVPGAVAHSAWAGVAQEQDVGETLQAVGGADWVVVDHYAFDARWHDALRAGMGARIAAIDDLADRRMAADLIVDHNHWPGPGGKYDAVSSGGTALIGPRYALLNPVYAVAPRYEFRDQVLSIGIFMGGVDAADASGVVLDALAGLDIAVEIATTSANPHLAGLRARDVPLSVDQPNLASFFARHDLQIGASGGASWERCCIGVPTLALVLAENQRPVAEPLAQLGVIATTGSLFPADRESIRAAVRRLIDDPAERRALSERSRALVDGCGAARVAEAMTR